jgi:hypothetical protein
MTNLTLSSAHQILNATTEYILFSGAEHTEIVKAIFTKIKCLEYLAANDIDRSWSTKLAEYKASVGA